MADTRLRVHTPAGTQGPADTGAVLTPVRWIRCGSSTSRAGAVTGTSLDSDRTASMGSTRSTRAAAAEGPDRMRDQRNGSGVTLTSILGRRFSVSTVIFEMRLFTFSGRA